MRFSKSLELNPKTNKSKKNIRPLFDHIRVFFQKLTHLKLVIESSVTLEIPLAPFARGSRANQNPDSSSPIAPQNDKRHLNCHPECKRRIWV